MGKENGETSKPKSKKLTHTEIAQMRGKEASIARKIVIIILIAMVAALIIGGYSIYKYIQEGISPVDPDSEEQIEVTIPLGSSSSDIANILEEAGIISNNLMYRFYVKFNNAADFQAGDYTLSPSMSLAEITDELETGSIQREPVLRVTVPEGRNLEEIADIYESKANIDAETFLEKVNDSDYISTLMDRYPTLLSDEILDDDIRYTLEGYLFPATYEFFEEEPSVETVVQNMLDKSRNVILSYYEQIRKSEEFSVHDVVTFASLVEEEAPSSDDRRLIASVFYNRMNDDMMLQTDPTVIYAHGEHISRLNYDHYEIDSPYNTYQVSGLPVGPIANFGESSLQAVIEPESTNYYYFLADVDGHVHYSRTYEEHQRKEAQYIHNN
ncbi:endolytic transglycosylase MltG [Gracilibacillus sp. YIM 98692]|uniref:endolytic transglycosylase MltG n=1 Tax=Gracilibacillus sp. YIM 98692 TaxID=2663532 RepID=UPI0013D7FFB9|nr:endolytic transglycosylase MltG [Gracilibacillus sp. YIM 98692]